MDDAQLLSEEDLVRDTGSIHVTRTVSITHGSVMRYHVQVSDVVIRDSVVSRQNVHPEQGHFESWEQAEQHFKKAIALFREEGFQPTSKRLLRMWTLYNDRAQRHYRQIAARIENDVPFVLVFEGTVLRKQPFQKEPSSLTRYECKSEAQAVNKAEELYEQSCSSGWSDYHPAFDS